MKKRPLLVLSGPTGVGKTELSLLLAEALDAEIISMDSMQIYRGMDIGTAKAGQEERKKVVHHMIDIADPGVRYTVRQYQQEVYRILEDIYARGKLPLLVGGTGLYLDAILKDFRFADFDQDTQLRRELQQAYDKDHGETLYQQLCEADPLLAKSINPASRKKLIRALEVFRTTGVPMSQTKHQEEISERWDALVLVLTEERDILYERINRRVDAMLAEGLIAENLRLLESGVPPYCQAMEAIGYKEVVWYLRGLLSFSEMRELLQKNSRHYAKRQLTWHRKNPNAVVIDKKQRDSACVFETMLPVLKQFLQKWRGVYGKSL